MKNNILEDFLKNKILEINDFEKIKKSWLSEKYIKNYIEKHKVDFNEKKIEKYLNLFFEKYFLEMDFFIKNWYLLNDIFLEKKWSFWWIQKNLLNLEEKDYKNDFVLVFKNNQSNKNENISEVSWFDFKFSENFSSVWEIIFDKKKFENNLEKFLENLNLKNKILEYLKDYFLENKIILDFFINSEKYFIFDIYFKDLLSWTYKFFSICDSYKFNYSQKEWRWNLVPSVIFIEKDKNWFIWILEITLHKNWDAF